MCVRVLICTSVSLLRFCNIVFFYFPSIAYSYHIRYFPIKINDFSDHTDTPVRHPSHSILLQKQLFLRQATHIFTKFCKIYTLVHTLKHI